MNAREVAFGTGNHALLLAADHRTAPELVTELGLDPPVAGRPVILVCGGADELKGDALDRARLMIETAVAPVAGRTGAAVVDGGTASGVMRLTGAARAGRPAEIPVLVGIAPAGLVSYPGGVPDRVPLDDGHSHFLLAASDQWGGETVLLMAVAQAIAGSGRVAVVLAGGGPVARTEIAAARRRGWPVFAIAGTGGLADSLAGSADVQVVSDPGEYARLLSWELHDEPLIKDAWQQFATYDQQAKRLRTTFTWLIGCTLALGVLATTLALLSDKLGGAVLHWAVVVAPLLVSVLIAVSGRWSFGQRWVLIRAAAESVKAEIYRYRALVAGGPAETGRPAKLGARLAAIDEQLSRTEASREPPRQYRGPLPPRMYGAGDSDDGLSALDPDRYLLIRVEDQARFYRGRVHALNRRRNALYLFAVLSGAAGAILAAAHQEIWVSFTAGAAAAVLAYLGYLQFDSTIVGYNQTAARLTRLTREWRALPPGEQTAEAYERLVVRCEAALAAEIAGWVRHQNEAVAESTAPLPGQ